MAGRSIADIESAKAALQGKQTVAAVATLPPGYYKGFRITSEDYQLKIGPGVMNCRGTAVYLRSTRILAQEEFVAPDHLVTGMTYYVYMDKAKTLLADSVDGLWDETNLGYYHPSLFQYHLIGQFDLGKDADNHWTFTNIVNQDPVDGSDIIADSIFARHLTTGSVGTTQIADDSISTAKLQADSIVAAKIAADAVEAEHMSADAATYGLLNATTAYIGFNSFSGTTALLSPGEGDTVVKYSNMAIEFLEYTDGGWTTVNGAKLGGFVSGLFLAMIGACGLYHPSNPPNSTEQLPHPNFRVFNFENNYNDQNGVDDWATKTNLAFSTAQKKYGSYSLFATASTEGVLGSPSGGTSGQSQTTALWFYMTAVGSNTLEVGEPLIIMATPGTVDRIGVWLNQTLGTNTIKLHIALQKGSSEKYAGDFPVVNNTWYYLALSYDATTDKLYVILNNVITDCGVMGGSWGVAAWSYLYMYPKNQFVHYGLTWDVYIDELLFYWDKYLAPELLAQHYTHNLAWATAYSKADILIRPNTDGRLMLRRVANDNKQVLTWVPVTNPTAGWLASMTTGWTADRFTAASGGMEVDFSSVVSAGTKEVMVAMNIAGTAGGVYTRPAGDDTYCSNTPEANTEQFARTGPISSYQIVRVRLNSEYKAEFAVANTGSDVYVSYPFEELR